MANPNKLREEDAAWRIYERINEFSDLLWEAYEQPFLAKIEAEMCMPEYPEMEPDDLDDEIPF